MKPKAKTLIEKQGFLDPDRSLPLHDEIQLWTYNNVVDVLRQFTTEGKTFDITYKQLEYPIIQTSPNFKNIVGFVDLFITGKVTTADGTQTKDFAASLEIKSIIPSCGGFDSANQFL